jgi:hypothetical protein
MQPVLEPGRHPEVAAAAAQRPKQVRMRLGVDVQQLAVGGHDLGGQQVVDGEAVLADQVANAAAEGDAAEPDRAGVTEPGRQPVGARRGGVLARGQACLCPSGAPFGVDVQRLHGRQVQHDPAVGGAVPGEAVTAAADRQWQPRLACQLHDVCDLPCVRDSNDDRWPVVEAAVEDGAGLVVAGVVGPEHSTIERSAQLRDRDGGLHEESSFMTKADRSLCWPGEGL